MLFENHFRVTEVESSDRASLMIPLGVNHQGSLEQLEITDDPSHHVLIAGHSGSGKANCLRAVLGSILLNYSPEQVNVWLADCGMCAFNCFVSTAPAHIKRVSISSEPASYAGFLDALDEEVHTRLSVLTKTGQASFYASCVKEGKPPFPRAVIVLDFFDRFVSGLAEVSRHCIDKLESIIKIASVCGITFIVAAGEAISLKQHLSQVSFDLFSIRLSGKQLSESCSVLFGSGSEALVRDLFMGEMVTNHPQCHKIKLLYISQETVSQICEKAKSQAS